MSRGNKHTRLTDRVAPEKWDMSRFLEIAKADNGAYSPKAVAYRALRDSRLREGAKTDDQHAR